MKINYTVVAIVAGMLVGFAWQLRKTRRFLDLASMNGAHHSAGVTADVG